MAEAEAVVIPVARVILAVPVIPVVRVIPAARAISADPVIPAGRVIPVEYSEEEAREEVTKERSVVLAVVTRDIRAIPRRQVSEVATEDSQEALVSAEEVDIPVVTPPGVDTEVRSLDTLDY